ncbi:MAG: acyl--CoA ligase [Rhodospirillales bacterium]|nr:acyl--CoA ligase [Rhodospirillales bacterium]
MLVHDYLRGAAQVLPHKVALIAGRERLTFGDLDAASDRLAMALQRSGIGRGDRVAVMLENGPDMVISLWGVLKAGAVFVPLHHATKEDKLAFVLADAEAAALIAPAALHQRAQSAVAQAPSVRTVLFSGATVPEGATGLTDAIATAQPNPVDPGLIDQDLCVIIYTSGSTGRPKGVMMTHANIGHNTWSISTYLGNVPDDVVLCVLPLSFDYGLFQVLTGARVGFTVVLERSFAFPAEAMARIAEHRVTGVPGVPTIFATMLQVLARETWDLSSVRYLTNTAAALPPAHIRRLRAILPGARIFSMFGLTECTRVSYLEPERLETKITSVGRPMPNTEAYVVDDRGKRLPAGEIGELVVRGSSVMRGYWRRPEATARALRDGELPGEKVLYTGDLFWMDADGDLYFVGRKDDVFKCRGEKVAPKEIENVLYELDAVAEAAIVGVPDDIDGMAVKAFVVLRDGGDVSEQALRRHCRGRLEPHLVPKHFEFCATLPKTDSGKITRTALRAAG